KRPASLFFLPQKEQEISCFDIRICLEIKGKNLLLKTGQHQ
ncbi:MAG: hypothetical protein RIR06_157, partial [Bacteroidota bacterium]